MLLDNMQANLIRERETAKAHQDQFGSFVNLVSLASQSISSAAAAVEKLQLSGVMGQTTSFVPHAPLPRSVTILPMGEEESGSEDTTVGEEGRMTSPARSAIPKLTGDGSYIFFDFHVFLSKVYLVTF